MSNIPNTKLRKWKTLKSEVVFDQKWMPIIRETVELSNGEILDDFYMWQEGDIVICIPQFQDGTFLMIRQYRHGLEDFSLEFPAGWREPQEQLEDSMKRELYEETGYDAQELQLLAWVKVAPGKIRGKTYVYTAKISGEPVAVEYEATEQLEVLRLSAAEIETAILTGKIIDSRIIAAWYLYLKKKDKS